MRKLVAWFLLRYHTLTLPTRATKPLQPITHATELSRASAVKYQNINLLKRPQAVPNTQLSKTEAFAQVLALAARNSCSLLSMSSEIINAAIQPAKLNLDNNTLYDFFFYTETT